MSDLLARVEAALNDWPFLHDTNLLADVRATRTAAAAPVPSTHPGSLEAGSALNTKQPAAAILKTCAEIGALMENTIRIWEADPETRKLIKALLNAAPALLKAAEQNERRGELLKLAAIEVGSEMSADLEDDIAKELP